MNDMNGTNMVNTSSPAVHSAFDIRAYSDKSGVLGTILFWLIMILLLVLIPVMPKKPVYKTVQIHLASSSPVQSVIPVQEKSPAPAIADSNPAEKQAAAAPAKAQAAKEEAPAKAAPAKKSASAKTKTVSPKQALPKAPAQTKTPAKQVLQKSVEELMAENNAPKKKQAQWDESAFSDSAEVSSSSSSASAVSNAAVKSVAALEGTAATGSSNAANTARSSSSSSARANGNAEAGSATKAALGTISSATYTQHSGNGVSSSATVNTGTDSSGNVSLQMDDGAPRALIDPKKPAIYLSEEAAKTIDSRKDVVIKFDVTAEGNVPVSGITITPASSFTPLVQKEIRDQIAWWRFQAASTPGKATIKYTVKPAD